jgi:hypothetical protein
MNYIWICVIFWGATSRISYTVSVRYLTNSVYRSSQAFGNEIEVYLTDLGNEFWILSHGFGIQFA